MLSYGRSEYDGAGRVECSITLDGRGYEQPTSYEYDAAGRQTAVIDPCGHDIDYIYDANLGVYEIGSFTFNDTHVTVTHYTGNRRDYVIDANDQITRFEYDALGRVIRPHIAQRDGRSRIHMYISAMMDLAERPGNQRDRKDIRAVNLEDKKDTDMTMRDISSM